VPETRKLWLHRRAEKGFGRDQLLEMQKVFDTEKSDINDVLAFVVYALTRQERAVHAS
jgi:type I restriction enzyme R subunit